MNSYTSKNFAVRKVRDGRVKVCGNWYAPRTGEVPLDVTLKRVRKLKADKANMNLNDYHPVYEGQLDGMRLAFGRYWIGEQEQHYLSLWGSEKAFNCDDTDVSDEADDWPGPNCFEGVFFWDWWERE